MAENEKRYGSRVADLDDLDITLIKELDSGPRKSYQQIADKLPTSRNTVRRRLQRLVDEKIITFVTLTSPPALGYLTHATMAITTRPGEAESVATELRAVPNISYLMTTTGRYDIVAAALFEDGAGKARIKHHVYIFRLCIL